MAQIDSSTDTDVVDVYRDESIRIVAAHGIAYYLTPCCNASGKGSMDAIVCRSCYVEVDDIFALGWNLNDDEDWERFRRHMIANHPVADDLLERLRTVAGQSGRGH
ncbi:hypothetical protein Br6_04963 [Rhodococcus sp. Br-6]|nr:hypothetical protein Br6_04963 [Rhodococcus sp. Br-6]